MEDEIDYDALYFALGLPPGAGPEAIQVAWKELAKLIHPDNYNPGPLRDAAQQRLVLLNDARDRLRSYWSQYNTAPPSKLKRHASSQAENPESAKDEEPESQPPPKEKTWQEEAYEAWKREYERRRRQEQKAATGASKSTQTPPVSPTRKSTKPFGPPPLKKHWHHDIYDLISADEQNPIIPLFFGLAFFGFCFIAAGILLSFVGGFLGKTTQYWMTDPLGELVLTALSAFFMFFLARLYLADCDLYVVRANPYLKPSGCDAQSVLATIVSTLTTNKFDGKSWTLLDSLFDNESQSYNARFLCHLPDSKVMLNARAMQATADSSMVTYWFDVDSIPFWRIPLARLLRRTDTALWKVLS